MTCPFCNNELEGGYLSIRPSAKAFFAFGHSPENLYFRLIDGSEIMVLPNDVEKLAYRCSNCSTVIIKK